MEEFRKILWILKAVKFNKFDGEVGLCCLHECALKLRYLVFYGKIFDF